MIEPLFFARSKDKGVTARSDIIKHPGRLETEGKGPGWFLLVTHSVSSVIANGEWWSGAPVVTEAGGAARGSARPPVPGVNAHAMTVSTIISLQKTPKT